MLTYRQGLKVYIFINFVIFSALILFTIIYTLLGMMATSLLAYLVSLSVSFATYAGLIGFIPLAVIFVKNLFFACLRHQFKNFSFKPIPATWKNFFKIFVFVQLLSSLGSSCIESLILLIQKGTLTTLQPTTFAIVCTIISDFALGGWLTQRWYERCHIEVAQKT